MRKQMPIAALGALHKGDLENFLVAASPGGIERQEKQGQIDQSFAETLPIDIGDQKPMFEKLGFVFGKPVDDLFVSVKWPEGWRKRCTDHSMHTDIIDAQGRKRGGIFYKAAFYDRNAHAHLSRRFDVGSDYGEDSETSLIRDACGKVEKKLAPLPRPNWGNREQATRRYEAIEAARKSLADWLDKEYPEWKSLLAYWD